MKVWVQVTIDLIAFNLFPCQKFNHILIVIVQFSETVLFSLASVLVPSTAKVELKIHSPAVWGVFIQPLPSQAITNAHPEGNS